VHFEGKTWCLAHWKQRRDELAAEHAHTEPISAVDDDTDKQLATDG
jgi:hypothetical protein